MTFDLVIIGSGPGGYQGAIRASQLGLKVAVVEKDSTFGGTCVRVGCIPSKALLESSEKFYSAKHGSLAQHGFEIGEVRLDLEKMQKRKVDVVKKNTDGVAYLFRKNKVVSFEGLGRIVAPTSVSVKKSDGTTEIITTKNILIATGSVPVDLPFLKTDEKRILSSTGALALDHVPESMIVIGGGVIGLELGSVWQRLGTKVTVVEFTDRLAGTTDRECVTVLKRDLEKKGMVFLLSTKVVSADTTGPAIKLEVEDVGKGTRSTLESEVVLVSVGRKPFTEGLGLAEAGVTIGSRGTVKVDEKWRTNVPTIYAIGDVIEGPMLAHKAEEEAVAVAETIAGHSGYVEYDLVPSVIYTHPEIATVGLTEDQAKERGFEVATGKFPFLANARARAMAETDGFVKIVADKKTDRILGGHIVGPFASELLGEIIIAMEFGSSSEDIGRSFHSHPTLTESIREAALAVSGQARLN